jgi:hypothetical protein
VNWGNRWKNICSTWQCRLLFPASVPPRVWATGEPSGINHLKPTGYVMHHQFNSHNCTLCPHCIYVFCVYLKTNSDLCHLHHKLIGFYNRDEKCLQRGTDWAFKWSGLRLCHLQHKLIGFYNEMKSVYSAVRTGSLNKAVCACVTYSINWLVFITEIKSVCSAVRTGALNNLEEKSCNKLCFIVVFFKWGQYDPMVLLT